MNSDAVSLNLAAVGKLVEKSVRQYFCKYSHSPQLII